MIIVMLSGNGRMVGKKADRQPHLFLSDGLDDGGDLWKSAKIAGVAVAEVDILKTPKKLWRMTATRIPLLLRKKEAEAGLTVSG